MSQRGIRDRAIGLLKLTGWNAGEFGPERVRLIDIESLVKIEPEAKARFVNVEEAANPDTEKGNHPGIAVRERDLPIPLVPFTRVKGDAGNE